MRLNGEVTTGNDGSVEAWNEILHLTRARVGLIIIFYFRGSNCGSTTSTEGGGQMINVSFVTDIREVRRALPRWQHEAIPKAVVSTLNRIVITVRKDAKRALQRRMGLRTQRYIADYLITIKARRARLVASVKGSPKPIPLIRFKGVRFHKRRGVRYLVFGQLQQRRHWFIAVMQSGHRGVFGRVSKARLPIKEKYGPPLSKVMVTSVVEREMQRSARRRWAEEFPRQLQYRLDRIRG